MKLKSNENKIWFTSDTHYGHKNMVKSLSSWEKIEGCRDFDSIEKMNTAIVDGINKYVGEDDFLIHLGDWSMGGYDNVRKFSDRLVTNKIVLVAGNHDEGIRKHKFETEHLFATIRDYLELTIDKKNMVLCHYPITSWNRAYRGSWMLHGHTHGTLFENRPNTHWYKTSKIMDVGLDVAFKMFGEYRPFSFEEIKTIMDKRKFISVDQHDEKTNG
jgi:calcineurin-like phosphoesterase family protein